MFLNATTKTLEIKLAKAITTAQLNVTVDYVDIASTTVTPAVQLATSNSTTAATILSAPSSGVTRKVNFLSVANTDTQFANVIIQLNDNGTAWKYVDALLLSPGSTLQFTDANGWSVVGADGAIQVTTGAAVDIQTFTASGTWTKPAAATYCQIDLVGGGGSGGGGQGAAAGVSRFSGGGGGGGFRFKEIFLASDLPNTVSVGVAASIGGGTGGVTANGISGSVGNVSNFGAYLVAFGGGGGGGGGTSTGGGGAGGSAAGATSAGGAAIGSGASASTASATAAGAGGGAVATDAGSAYLGAGGGGGGANSVPGIGGSSYFSGAGGAGGGGVTSTNVGYDAKAGGSTGGSATAGGGGGAAGVANTSNGTAGAAGDSTKCGTGGGGGGGNNAGTGYNGGNGGAPGGGGGGGGGGTSTGGNGGSGAAGRCVVISW